MVNLESDTPYFYWTFDRFEDLQQKRGENGFENSVWKSDVIPSYDIWETQLSFAPPEEWGVGHGDAVHLKHGIAIFDCLVLGILHAGRGWKLTTLFGRIARRDPSG